MLQGCDASVLLDSIDGVDSEKESPPNETLKGFDIIEIIKSDLEEASLFAPLFFFFLFL